MPAALLRGLMRASSATLGVLAILGALMTAAPVLVLAVIAGSWQGGWETLAHLAGTVLPAALLTSLGLALVVLATVLLLGVGSAWLVAAYEFPGRRWRQVARWCSWRPWRTSAPSATSASTR